MSESQIMSEVFDILATNEPMSTTQIQRELFEKVSQSDLNKMLNRVAFSQDGIVKGKTSGTIVKTSGGLWTVKQTRKVEPADIVARIL